MPIGQHEPMYLTIAHRLHHHTQLWQKLDAHNTKAESIQLRKKWLERNGASITSRPEHDRMHGLLSQSILPPGMNEALGGAIHRAKEPGYTWAKFKRLEIEKQINMLLQTE